MSDTTAAHQAATTRMHTLAADAASAHAVVAGAKATRQAVLDRIAAGERGSPQQLHAASDAIREAEAQAEVADAIATAGKAAADRAEVALLATQAEAIRAEFALATAESVQAAAEADMALDAARKALERLAGVKARIVEIANRARLHDLHAIPDAVRRNRVLAGRHPGEWPMVRVPVLPPPDPLHLSVYRTGAWGEAPTSPVTSTLEAMERFRWAIP